jgi:hypothetical protein
VLLGNMPDKVSPLNVTLLPISFGDIDQTRALRAKHIHTEAQSLSLGIIVRGIGGDALWGLCPVVLEDLRECLVNRTGMLHQIADREQED